MHASILKLIKYDEFATSTLDSILLEQTESSTFRLSSAYRYLIKSWSVRLVSVQLKQAGSWSFRLVSVLLKQAESWSFSLVSVCRNCRIIKFQWGFHVVSVAETASFAAETTLNLGRSISIAAVETAETETPLKLHWNFKIPEGWRQDSNIGNSFFHAVPFMRNFFFKIHQILPLLLLIGLQ